MKHFLFLIIVLLTFTNGKAQFSTFGPAIKIPYVLNGNFGEIRSNHFHAGIDVKTNGASGLPVLAVDDGFVSRITVSATGYGNAIYIEHSSGYTSVYGHLEEFAPTIQKWVKDQQYEKESFEVNLEPQADLFRVKKGDQIALSGNSGSSGGPHLHLEIRKTNNQHPVNPLLNGFDVPDKTKPVVTGLYIYPIDDESRVKGASKKQRFNLSLQSNGYKLKEPQVITVSGQIGFGIETYDLFDNNWSKCGIYTYEVWVDSLLINSFSLGELAYEKMRQMNSLIDYEEFVSNNRIVEKGFIEPGNNLDIYSNPINRGIFTFDDLQTHNVRIRVSDANSNKSDIVFQVKSVKQNLLPATSYTSLFRWDRKNTFENEKVELSVPEDALFTDVKFNYKELANFQSSLSPVFQLGNKTIALNRNVKIKIKASNLPDHLEDKAVICRVDLQNNSLQYIGGKYFLGWVETESRTLGSFTLSVDTIAPKIIPLSFSEKNNFKQTKQIQFKITDGLSGIATYRGCIDDKWVLFAYDAKSDRLTYRIDEHLQKGKKHQLKLVVCDKKENRKEYNTSFNY